MKCSNCEGKGMALFFDDYSGLCFEEICAECYGIGEIPDESTAYSNDCPGGQCEF